MQFCQPHWDSLRQAIKDKGLGVLVSETGEEAVTKAARQAAGEDTVDTFDPLMFAHNIIFSNVLENASQSVGYLMGDGPEDPVEGHEGRTWPRCPICYLNLAHEISCGGCDLPQETGYDWMIDRSSDDALTHWEGLKV